jgi:transposase InsO family protein
MNGRVWPLTSRGDVPGYEEGPQKPGDFLDRLFVFSERNLRRALSAYVSYYNRWRPHRSLGQAAPCGEAMSLQQQACRKTVAKPMLGGLRHIYKLAE